MVTRHLISSLTFKIEGDATAVASRMASESRTFYILHMSLDLYIFLLQFSFTRIIFHFYFILSHIVSHTPPSNLLNSFFLEGELIARIDTDGNGTLDEQEFLTVSQSFISPQRAITNTNTVSSGV